MQVNCLFYQIFYKIYAGCVLELSAFLSPLDCHIWYSEQMQPNRNYSQKTWCQEGMLANDHHVFPSRQ